MRFIQTLCIMALCGYTAITAAQSTIPEFAPEKEKTGTIQSLDIGANNMIVDGNRYRMAPDVTVEIRGGHGAFTMLHVGMKIFMVYRVINPSDREVVRVEQLPDNYQLEEV